MKPACELASYADMCMPSLCLLQLTEFIHPCCTMLVALLRYNESKPRVSFATIGKEITRETSGENSRLRKGASEKGGHGKKDGGVVAERERIVLFRGGDDDWVKWTDFLTTDTQVGQSSSMNTNCCSHCGCCMYDC